MDARCGFDLALDERLLCGFGYCSALLWSRTEVQREGAGIQELRGSVLTVAVGISGCGLEELR